MANYADNRPNAFARVPQHKDAPVAGKVPSAKGSAATKGPAGAPSPRTPPVHADAPVAGRVPASAGSRTSSSSPPHGRGAMKQHECPPAAGALPTMHEHADALHPVSKPRRY